MQNMSLKRVCALFTGILLILSITLTGCRTNEKITEYPVTLEQVLTEVNTRNQSIVNNLNTEYTTDYVFDVDMSGFTEEELSKLFTPGYMSGVKPEKAKKDIELLFRILEGSYAGYAYFGGAPAFDQAKSNILRDIETYGDKNISGPDFRALIVNHLAFVIDSHLSIGGFNPGFEEAYLWYDKNNYEYRRDSKGYYTLVDGEKWYISENMSPYLEYTIGESGEIVYAPFFVGTVTERELLPKQITLASAKEDKEIEILWEKSSLQNAPSSEYERKDMDGIKAAVIAAFLATHNTNTMINDAKELSNDDYSIIDLRYNIGGLLPDVTMWLYNFTGKEIYPKGSALLFASKVNDYWLGPMETEIAFAYRAFDFAKENPEFFNNMLLKKSDAYKITSINDGIRRIDYKPQWTQRDGKVLFLLNGKDNISSGEYFIEASRSMENTLVVGTNSGGCLKTGGVNAMNSLYLPHSHIGIIYSSILWLNNTSKEFDKYGILPDIYIGAGDSAEAVTRCIRYYQSVSEE